METILTAIFSGFTPLFVNKVFIPATKINTSSTQGYIMMYAALTFSIFLITFFRNMICNLKLAFNKKRLANYGWSAAMWKGAILSIGCLLALIVIPLIPFVKIPLMTMYASKPNLADGLIITFSYLAIYYMVTLLFIGKC